MENGSLMGLLFGIGNAVPLSTEGALAVSCYTPKKTELYLQTLISRSGPSREQRCRAGGWGWAQKPGKVLVILGAFQPSSRRSVSVSPVAPGAII